MERSKFIGGSDVAAIMGLSPWKSAYQLWEEKTGRKVSEDISGLFHVQRGIINEPLALVRLEEQLDRRFIANKRFTDGHRSGEVDAIDDTSIVEIKCMGENAHKAVQEGNAPEHYILQVQYYMLLAQRQECIFVSYRPEDDTLHHFIVKADVKLQDKIVKAVDKYWTDNILADVAPELGDLDLPDMSAHAEYKQFAERYKELNTEKKAVEKALSETKAELGKLLAASNSTKARGCGLVLNKHERKGSVEYAKIPELKGVNLEAFRKKAISVFTIKESKS